MSLTNEQIEKAVNWWSEVIKNPKKDNGDDSPAGFMTAMLSGMTTQQIPDEKINKFKQVLKEKLKTHQFAGAGLRCDYEACGILGEAMDEAEVPGMNAPWKTNMWFEDGGVQVSYGYRAKVVTL